MPNDDERPRKSWSEIDKMRSQSAHRREDKPSGAQKRLESSQAYRSYKSQLDKLFDGGGGLPEALKGKLEEAGIGAEGKARKEKAAAIKDAAGPGAIRDALAAYRQAFGAFPEDEEALGQILTLDDGPLVAEALRTLERLREAAGLKRAASLKGRIKTAQMTVDDDEVVHLAKALLAKL